MTIVTSDTEVSAEESVVDISDEVFWYIWEELVIFWGDLISDKRTKKSVVHLQVIHDTPWTPSYPSMFVPTPINQSIKICNEPYVG